MITAGIDSSVSEYEIIIVDDGSLDNSRELICGLREADKRVRAVFHNINSGKGAALLSGFKQAKMEWVLTMDADLQIDIAELKSFLPFCTEFDLIAGRRISRNEGVVRSIVSRIYNLAASAVIGTRIRDVGCPFKLVKRSILLEIPLTAEGFAIDAEIFLLARASNYRIREQDVNCRSRLKGKSTVRFRHFIATFFELVLLKVKNRP